jgi:hypothetical protein
MPLASGFVAEQRLAVQECSAVAQVVFFGAGGEWSA